MKIQDAFKELLKDHFAPMMRKLGFKGSGQKYSYPADDYFIQIGIQKSQYSDSERISFTLNIQIIGKEEWNEVRKTRDFYPEKPSANTFYGVGKNERIGLMTPQNLDKWWDYGLDAKELSILDEIRVMIETYVLPEIAMKVTTEPNQA